MGWLPYRTREEFVAYRAEHPELEPFPPYNFGASGDALEKEAEERGSAPRGHSFYVSDQRTCLLVSNYLTSLQGWPRTLRMSSIRPWLGRKRPRHEPSGRRNPGSSSRPMEVPGSLTREGHKARRSSKPIGEVERRGRKYYFCPALDALEAAFPPWRWGELKGATLEHKLSHLESSAVAVSLKFALLSYGLSPMLYLIGC